MTLKKTLLIPAALVAGLTVAALAGCATETAASTAAPTSTSTASSVGTATDILETSAKSLPFIEDGVTESDGQGSEVTGDYTLTYKTTLADAKAEAAKLLKAGGLTDQGGDKYSNDKWTVTLEGTGSKVVYKLDRK
ncbi:hypothetical protein ACRAWB_14880 [Leifsonia poae]|uniref:hypothetical protein n=1 Tax=Leifsonia poae TaxID=110933 RepID=UPI003D69BF6D